MQLFLQLFNGKNSLFLKKAVTPGKKRRSCILRLFPGHNECMGWTREILFYQQWISPGFLLPGHSSLVTRHYFIGLPSASTSMIS